MVADGEAQTDVAEVVSELGARLGTSITEIKSLCKEFQEINQEMASRTHLIYNQNGATSGFNTPKAVTYHEPTVL